MFDVFLAYKSLTISGSLLLHFLKMEAKHQLICFLAMCAVVSSSGEMFLEPGVHVFNMSSESNLNRETLMIMEKSMFAKSEIGIRVISCSTGSNEPCKFNIEWTLRHSDCDGVYRQLFNEVQNNDTQIHWLLGELYSYPNCFRMAEEKRITFVQSVVTWPNPLVTVDDAGVNPQFLHDLNITGMNCSNRDEEPGPCNLVPFCGVPVTQPSEDSESSSGNTEAPGNGGTADNGKTVADADNGDTAAGADNGDTAAGADNGETGGNSPNSRRRRADESPAKKDNPETEGKKPATLATKKPDKDTQATKKPDHDTWHVKSRVATTNQEDGRYLLVISMKTKVKDLNVTFKVEMKGPSGYLSATQYPLLPFYGVMCAVYTIMGLVWMVLLFRQWKDLLRIQFWISVVIILGLIEKAAFVAEFERHNKTGESSNSGVFIAEELSVLKRTMARMLVIIVSLGYGITRPRLGRDLNWVLGAGCLFFFLSSLEVYFRISQSTTNNLISLLPLSVLDAVLCWWIFRSLVDTTRTLNLRRNLVKLWLYRHLTNALIFCVVAAIIFLVWSLKVHKLNACVKEWNEIWLDDAYWHILFCVILVVIMILIRPTANNQRYAYSVLSDAADDDAESKEPMMNDAFETVKMRNVTSNKSSSQDRRDEDDLKWVEDNIPAAVADAVLGAFDDSEEELITSVERNKME